MDRGKEKPRYQKTKPRGDLKKNTRPKIRRISPRPDGAFLRFLLNSILLRKNQLRSPSPRFCLRQRNLLLKVKPSGPEETSPEFFDNPKYTGKLKFADPTPISTSFRRRISYSSENQLA